MGITPDSDTALPPKPKRFFGKMDITVPPPQSTKNQGRMMKRTILFLVACTSSPAWAADPSTLPMALQMQKAANAATCESYKGDTSAIGKAVNKNCRNRAKAEFEEMQDEKPLRDCMKPGNVIDDDVRKCMKGM